MNKATLNKATKILDYFAERIDLGTGNLGLTLTDYLFDRDCFLVNTLSVYDLDYLVGTYGRTNPASRLRYAMIELGIFAYPFDDLLNRFMATRPDQTFVTKTIDISPDKVLGDIIERRKALEQAVLEINNSNAN